MRSATSIPSAYKTLAFSVAKLTVAVTPSMRLSFFSTRAAHEAQVMPPMESSTSAVGAAVVPGTVFSRAVLVIGRISWERPGRTASVSAERHLPAWERHRVPGRTAANGPGGPVRPDCGSGRADELVAGLVDRGAH